MEYITIIFLQVIILVVFFDTDAFIEYCKLSRQLTKLFKIDDFQEKYTSNFELTYHIYLRQYHSNFFTKLITCPICLNTWISIISAIIIGNVLTSFCFIMFFSLFLYYLLKKLMN